MPVDAKPSRHWLTFSLRTLFVSITILGVPGGWMAAQWHCVRARKSMLEQWYAGSKFYEPLTAPYFVCTPDRVAKGLSNMNAIRKAYPHKSFSIPWFRQLLGDQPMVLVWVSREQMHEAESLFPEAVVWIRRVRSQAATPWWPFLISAPVDVTTRDDGRSSGRTD